MKKSSTPTRKKPAGLRARAPSTGRTGARVQARGKAMAESKKAADAADRNGDLDGDGYTNLEEFLAERAASLN